MNIKNKLKERLLEIPSNGKFYREKHRLAEDIDAELRMVEFYLNEMAQLNILIEKIEYKCPSCGETEIMSDEVLSEIIEDDCFECENCMDTVDVKRNTTGYVYYDIKDRALLEAW